ncbi:HlyD family secretion protein [Vibrio viridaestus]|uniref:HlyD family secretion protein n=1 Tax=Vibrio viridaestus TaxID=2487322 RepID=A0A3N9TLP9_9VIBR|nr:HlyD family secretion protein [Vibrio viridaestus]RQW65061.1 HlyD family secretion protein [Vibrio viridaestus]
MTPDQKFARWVKYSMCVFVAIFIYFLIADMLLPLTPQAMATRVVTKIAPRVNGPIEKINVSNNQHVEKGDVLFEIDPVPYQLAVEQAKLALEEALQNNSKLDAAILAAEANVTETKVIYQQKVREAKRLDRLFLKNSTSQKLKDDAESEATAAKANLLAAQSQLQELKVQRGKTDNDNIAVRIAKNNLEKAQLNLQYTEVKADHAGTITNLQLQTGAFAQTGQPVVALVDNKVEVIADFREKSLRNFADHTHALIAFDGQPGKIFSAEINTIDAGVSSGQFDANGQLATPTDSNRWVRDAQRMRIHLSSQHAIDMSLPSGARATVQLVPSNVVLAFVAKVQIKALSLLHYIY